MFLENRAVLDAKDFSGDSAYTLADRGNHTQVMRALLKLAPWEEFKDARGDSPLLRAAREGRWEQAEALTAQGAGAASRGVDGATPLRLAARAGRPARHALAAMLRRGSAACNQEEILRALEAAGDSDAVWTLAAAAADLVRGPAGQAALLSAARDCRQSTLGALLTAGVRPTQAELGAAAMGGHVACVQTLRKAGAPALAEAEWEEALRQAAAQGRHAEVAGLLAAGVNPNAKTSNGNTALFLASKEGHAQCVRELLEHGADKEAQNPSLHGGTALIAAARYGRLEVLKMLLAAGANKEARDTSWGSTAIHFATNSNQLEVVKTLLAAGANLHAERLDRRTTLIHPAERNYKEMVQFLLKAGVNVNARDSDNRTALSWAVDNKNMEIANILRAAGGKH